MTEVQWLVCADPNELFCLADDQFTIRKVRLFAVAGHRHMCVDGKHPWMVLEQLERWADSAEQMPEGDLASLGRHYVLSSTLERTVQADLLREIFGNPFRPVAFDPQWRTSTVNQLAAGIYEEQAFERLPVLADALQDAGCDSDDLLNHLRDPNATHVRGCWALDLVLGK